MPPQVKSKGLSSRFHESECTLTTFSPKGCRRSGRFQSWVSQDFHSIGWSRRMEKSFGQSHCSYIISREAMGMWEEGGNALWRDGHSNDTVLTRNRSKKKKWSKGKVKDKANNAVVLDKPTLYVFLPLTTLATTLADMSKRPNRQRSPNLQSHLPIDPYRPNEDQRVTRSTRYCPS